MIAVRSITSLHVDALVFFIAAVLELYVLCVDPGFDQFLGPFLLETLVAAFMWLFAALRSDMMVH